MNLTFKISTLPALSLSRLHFRPARRGGPLATLPGMQPDRVTQQDLIRWAEAFETLRERGELAGGKVFFANLGALAAFGPRAQFARNLFAAGGIASIGEEAPYPSREAMIDAFENSGARVAVICGADAAYAEEAENAAQRLKAARCDWVMLAGKPGEREHVLRTCDLGFGHRLMMDHIVPGGVSVDLMPEAVGALRALAGEIGHRQRPHQHHLRRTLGARRCRRRDRPGPHQSRGAWRRPPRGRARCDAARLTVMHSGYGPAARAQRSHVRNRTTTDTPRHASSHVRGRGPQLPTHRTLAGSPDLALDHRPCRTTALAAGIVVGSPVVTGGS